ncbi:MAG: hypothetical protein ACI4S0_12445 [Dorea sp.]
MKTTSESLMEKLYDRGVRFSEGFEAMESEPFLHYKQEYEKMEKSFRQQLSRNSAELETAYQELMIKAKDVADMQYYTLFLEGARTGARLMLELLAE